jgi:hypothetical protein
VSLQTNFQLSIKSKLTNVVNKVEVIMIWIVSLFSSVIEIDEAAIDTTNNSWHLSLWLNFFDGYTEVEIY